MDALSDKKERRRLQNKLAQKRFRQRVRAQIECRKEISGEENGSGEGSVLRTSSSRSSSVKDDCDTDLPLVRTSCAADGVLDSGMTDPLRSGQDAAQAFLRALMSPSPGAGIAQLFMPQFHFAHALYGNADRMGLSRSQIEDYYCVSTIGEAWVRLADRQGSSPTARLHEDNRALHESMRQVVCQKISAQIKTCRTEKEHGEVGEWRLDDLPPNMQPTTLQMTIEHHPYIDVAYPWPAMRDRILLLMDVGFDEEDLCHYTLCAQEKCGEPAFTIWGDDLMDESAYEVSKTFAEQWWFLLDQSIMRRTNWWRRQRGLAPIVNDWIV